MGKRPMIKIILAGILMVGVSSQTIAQSAWITGRVTDAYSKDPISEASLILLNARDSFLMADVRSDQKGIFNFSNIPKDNYILLVSYPNYVDFVEKISVDSSASLIDLHSIGLTLQAKLLKDIVITGRKKSAVRFKNDTTEYVADSFHLPANASVEDLLKQLPGLQVDKEGKITVQGKTIQKVLIDGEEFFSDDPTLVTRNLKSNMVDKVQFYKGKSDQAAFTGIDDGKTTNTLNLKLKKDKKHGYFGKIQIGGGNQRFYQNQAMFNSFEGNRKFAAYFTLSNTSLIGLDRRSQQSYAGGDANPISNDLDKWYGTFNGVGIPRSISGGLHYDNKWNADKQFINTNYKLGGLDIMGNQKAVTQTNIPGNILYATSDRNTKNHMLRQGLNIAYKIKFDSSSTLQITAESSLLGKTTTENDRSDIKRKNLDEISNTSKNIATTGQIRAVKSSVLWQKRLKKERRTFSLNFKVILNHDKSTGSFYTNTRFIDSVGNLDGSQVVDQHKSTKNHAESYSLQSAYTTPVSQWGYLVANYRIATDNAFAELLSFNKSAANNYDNFDSLHSNRYQFTQLSNRGGLAYIYNKGKVRVQFGNDIGVNNFTQINFFTNTSFRRSFINWFPKSKFAYSFSPEKTFSFNYSGNTVQPVIQQLEPVINNNDPLNIYVGNESVKPTFINNFSLSYQTFGKNSKFLWLTANYSDTYNPITTSVKTNDRTGINTYTYVNLNGQKVFDYAANLFYSGKSKIWDLGLGINAGFDGNKYANISNDVLNTTYTEHYQLTFTVSKARQNVYSAGVAFGPGYNHVHSSLDLLVSNDYWSYQVNPNADVYLPGKFQVHTEGEYTWQGKTQTFTHDFSRFLWNGWIEKKILKNNALLFKLSVHDILNQNIGFTRNTDNNIIYQNRYTTIGRYFMISAIWDFNKTGVQKK